MIEREVIYLVATALGHATYGVNAQLAGVPRIGSERLPPNVATISQGLGGLHGKKPTPVGVGQTTPGARLDVFVPDTFAFDADVFTVSQDIEVPVAIRYVSMEKDPSLAYTDAMYTLRAITKTMVDWFGAVSGDRTINEVAVFTMSDAKAKAFSAETNNSDHPTVSGLIYTLTARNSAP